jgi:hypothetical protein
MEGILKVTYPEKSEERQSLRKGWGLGRKAEEMPAPPPCFIL